MYKKFIILTLLFTLVISISSCASGEVETDNIKPGDELSLLKNVELDLDNVFFDDFTNGVNPENWYIAKQAWGGSNGGVIPENLSYTDDGILRFRGNGGYYQEAEVRGVGDVKDGRYTGAALISNFVTGPGRYEIKMKVLPRIGACTAFWTYAYEFNDQLNHEIDIELPGGNRSGTPTFANLLNTNYTKESQSYSQDIKLNEIFNEEIYLNDGEWHTFGFDWYTDPEMIVYYLDGKVCAISDLFIPNLQSRLWLGVWFPVSSAFVGSAEFETDYMEVDYVTYIPFKNQPYTAYVPITNGVAALNEYPTLPTTANVVNKVSNGTFEYISSGKENYSGWKLEKYITEKQDVNEVCNIQNGIGYESSKALFVKDGGVASQIIDAVYNNFSHNLTFKAKGKGTLVINYYSIDRTTPLKSVTIDIDSENFYDYYLSLTAPSNSQVMEIQFDTYKGDSIIIDNVSLVLSRGE